MQQTFYAEPKAAVGAIRTILCRAQSGAEAMAVVDRAGTTRANAPVAIECERLRCRWWTVEADSPGILKAAPADVHRSWLWRAPLLTKLPI